MKKGAGTSGQKVRFLFLEGEEELTVEIGCCCTAVFNFYGYLLRRSLFSGPTRARNKPAMEIYRQSRTAQTKFADFLQITLPQKKRPGSTPWALCKLSPPPAPQHPQFFT